MRADGWHRGNGHGVEMRLIAVLGAICALTQTASAEIGDCSAIADAAAKLACYNNEASPAAKKPMPTRIAPRSPAAARPAASTTESNKYIDKIGDEDAIVNAKMRNICRGC
jgi:hypothetical protein